MTKKTGPYSRKRFTDTECLVIVQDLLGFASPLRDARWNPSASEIEGLLDRLNRFQNFTGLAGNVDRIFALNDTIVRVLDTPCPLSQSAQVLQWLYHACLRHSVVNASELEDELPGARTVLAGGRRYKVSEGDIAGDDPRFFAGGGVKPEIKYYCPTELQLNLAFTRAYLLNEAGSKAGIGGNLFYMDTGAIDLLKRSIGKEDVGNDDKINDLVVEERDPEEWRLSFRMPRMYTWCAGPICSLRFALPPIDVEQKGMMSRVYRVTHFAANTDVGPYFPTWGPNEMSL
jgi:hypothetical protein